MKIFLALVLILVFVAFIVGWPLLMIWAINTLAPVMSIPYSFWTWLAVVVLNISTFGGLQATIKARK